MKWKEIEIEIYTVHMDGKPRNTLCNININIYISSIYSF